MTIHLSIGARIRKSPFFNRTVAAGLTHASVYNHMYMPTAYGDLAAEYDRLINGVSMWDVSVQRQVSLKGVDAYRLARLMTPRNLDGLVIGQGLYVPLCNSRGILLNDPVLQRISDDEIWLSIADNDMGYWAQGLAAGFGMDVEITEPDVAPLAIQGPKSPQVTAAIFGDWVDDLSYFGFKATSVAGIPLILARSGWSKQGGFELYLQDSAKADALWDIVAEAGAPYGIGPGSPNYIERVESGLISVGADTDENSNPLEMGLGRFMDLEQDFDFIGKAALRSIASNGVKRRFCGVVLDGAPLPSTNQHRWRVRQDGNDVGYISAAAYSPRFEKNIAVGVLGVAAIESGHSVDIAAEDGHRTGRITSLPFRKG